MLPFSDSYSLSLLNSIMGTLFILLYILIVMRRRNIRFSLLIPNILMLTVFVLMLFFRGTPVNQMLVLFALCMFFQEATGDSIKPFSVFTLLLYTLLYGLILHFTKKFLPRTQLLPWLTAFGPLIPGIIYSVRFVSDMKISRYNRVILSALAVMSTLIHIPIILSAYLPLLAQGEALRVHLSLFVILGWNLAITGRENEKTEQSKEESKNQLKSLIEQIDTLHSFLQHKDPGQDISSLYPRFFKILQESTGIKKAVIYLLNPEETELQLQAQQGLDQTTVEYLKILPWDLPSTTREAMEKQQTIMTKVADYSSSKLKEVILQQNISLLGSHPIISNGKAVGAVTFGLEKDQKAEPGMEEILKVLSIQMGTALFNLKWFRQMSESEIRFKNIFNNLKEGILIFDTSQKIILQSIPLQNWLKNDNSREVLHPLILQLKNHFPKKDFINSVLSLSSGKKIFIKARIIDSNYEGQPVFVCILQDCSQEKELQEKLDFQKGIDPETGILSRRLVENIFKKEQERAERFQHPFSLLMIGMEKKELPPGIIKPIAQALKKRLENYEYLCYNGNGSFALLLPEGNIEMGIMRAEALLKSAATFKLPGTGIPKEVKWCIGMDTFIGKGKPEDIRYYWRNAEEALDISRKTGGNRLVRWTKDQI